MKCFKTGTKPTPEQHARLREHNKNIKEINSGESTDDYVTQVMAFEQDMGDITEDL